MRHRPTARGDSKASESEELPAAEKMLAKMAPLAVGDFDWEAATYGGVDDEAQFTIDYMARTEAATALYQRNLQSTSAGNEYPVDAFLCNWLEEEVAHGAILARFLDRAGATGHGRVGLRGRVAGEFGRIANKAACRLWGDRFFAVHMCWGAINERTAVIAYQQLQRRTDNALLDDILDRIIAQERRHWAFYCTEARRRLDSDPEAQRFVRKTLDRFWSPVGVGISRRAQFDRVMRYLMTDARERIDEADTAIGEIPGLEGLGLIARADLAAFG